jgi:RND superfamily putative drug exporter
VSTLQEPRSATAPRSELPGGRPRRLWAFGVLAVLVLLVGLGGGGFQSKLADVQKNDNSAFLPASAESTKVDKLAAPFTPTSTIPGFLVYQRAGGLTAADRSKVAADAQRLSAVPGVAGDQVAPPTFSRDGTAVSILVPLATKTGDNTATGPELSAAEKRIEAVGKASNPSGLVVHTAGAGGLIGALIDAFNGIDGKLLLVAGIVVILLLLIVYRSPVLWFFPLFSAVLSLGAASLVIYFLAKGGVITLNGQSQGILSVLVIGAGTDYALLLISRYREELHNYHSRRDAMIRAWRGAAPAILASATTVITGLLCLLVSQLNSNRGLGPVSAIGIACTVVVMLTFLPVALVLCGRWIFWPRIPRVDHSGGLETHGVWGRVAEGVGRRSRRSWVAAALVLFACVALVPTLRDGGLSTAQAFTSNPDAVQGQKIYDAQFSQGAGAPAVILTNAAQLDAVTAAVRRVEGVEKSPGAVCLQPDYVKLAALVKANPALASGRGASGAACLPSQLSVSPRDGRTVLNATLSSAYDSEAAYATIQHLRTAVHAVPGADALVGGQSGFNLDVQKASTRDRNVIIPLVLLVILLVLAVVLRAVVAPLLLITTVVLSFAATLGVCAVAFNHVFRFPNSDPSFPLFAFIFLVALGIDYNIFLMTRVREEALRHGTRRGVLRGLSVTGGVITSAGVVLASTFAVLGVLPLVFLAELGFAVAFGVLLDTLLVRSVLVPALSYDIGRRIWWPSKLGRGAP